MSGICGFVGAANPAVLGDMLAAIDYRGNESATAQWDGAGLGYRWWSGRPGKSPGIHREGSDGAACAGTLAPAVPSPAAALVQMLKSWNGQRDHAIDVLRDLDGAFAGAWWDAAQRRLTLLRDPFGVRSLYYVEHAGVFYFASELKQLLAIPGLPVEVNPAALHKYLTFSFVPGEDVPVRGIKRLLPGHLATWQDGRLSVVPYFTLREQIDQSLADPKEAVQRVRSQINKAVGNRLNGEKEVGLFLSGGLDSSAVAWWLKKTGVGVRAFSLDFGEASVEKAQAETVARQLEIPLSFIKINGGELAPVMADMAWKLDLPFGDAVTGPQYLMGKAAREAGLEAVFNGEGGDQFFGGWTNKPMISAELYADLYGEDSREEAYLRSYHRFYGFEEQLYTPEFRAQIGGPGQRRALLTPYLQDAEMSTFLHRIRMADIGLKGSQNILPRMERMSNAWALDARVPLFDRQLAELSFTLPPQMKLRGACEKYVLKLALKNRLPSEIIWRRKFGMSVPITDWALGPLAGVMHELLGPESLARRGLFRTEYVESQLQGQGAANETRRRRVGERLWTLAMLEAWMRVFIDGRGRRPGAFV